jgi:hypothetical protein
MKFTYFIYLIKLIFIHSDLTSIYNQKQDLNKQFSKLYDQFSKATKNITYSKHINNEYEYYLNINEKDLADFQYETDKYDVNNRFIQLNKFIADGIFTYHIINIKAISKHDTGFFTNTGILLIGKNVIRVFDIYSNLLKEFKVDYSIDDVFTLNDGKMLLT